MTLLATVYCTEAELNRYLSSQGVIDFADNDDDGSADTGVVDDCINQATEEIDLYARQRYNQSDLSSSTLINRWAVTIAARFLCQRRGNVVPDVIEREWNRIADPDDGILVRISKGLMQLPNVPLRESLRPTFSNLKIDRRYNYSTVRVTRPNSSDAPTKMTQDALEDLNGSFD